MQLLYGGSWVNVSMVDTPGLAVAAVCRQLGFAGGVAADPPQPAALAATVTSSLQVRPNGCNGFESALQECGCVSGYNCGSASVIIQPDVLPALVATCIAGAVAFF